MSAYLPPTSGCVVFYGLHFFYVIYYILINSQSP